MCIPMAAGLIGLMTGAGGAGVTAAGAAASALSLQGVGTALSVGGSLVSGVMGMQAANAQADMVAQQAKTSAEINATEDQRVRRQMLTQLRTQTGELVARGIDLSSASSIALGMSGAREMSFASQAVRATGQAEQAELSSQQQLLRTRGMTALWRGGSRAASTLLTNGPDLWPGLLA